MDVLKHTTLIQLRREVARVAERCPLLAERAERAATIILSGKISPLGDGRHEVVGYEPRAYVVNADARTCECKDFAHRAPEFKGSRWCKHLIAVLMLAALTVRGQRSPRRLARLATFRPAATRRPVRVAA